jgi:hypothetical protein
MSRARTGQKHNFPLLLLLSPLFITEYKKEYCEPYVDLNGGKKMLPQKRIAK